MASRSTAAFVFLALFMILGDVSAQICTAGSYMLLNSTCDACRAGFVCARGAVNSRGGMGPIAVTSLNAGSTSSLTWVSSVNTFITNMVYVRPILGKIWIIGTGYPTYLVSQSNSLDYSISDCFQSQGTLCYVVANKLSSGFQQWTTRVVDFAVNSMGTKLFAAFSYSNCQITPPCFNGIMTLDLTGVVANNNFQVLVGGGSMGIVDGTGGTARFSDITAISSSSLKQSLWIVDNNKLRYLDVSTALVTTVFSPSSSNKIVSLAVANDDNVYLMIGNLTAAFIVNINPNGSFRQTWIVGGPSGAAASITYVGMFVHSSGAVYFSDPISSQIRALNVTTGVIISIAGKAGIKGTVDGPGNQATFFSPAGLFVDQTGTVFVSDSDSKKIRFIEPATLCPAGRFCQSGAKSLSGSGPCMSGYYCLEASSSAFANACPLGRYCLGGTSSSSGEGLCDAGYYCGGLSNTKFGGSVNQLDLSTFTIAGNPSYRGYQDGIGTNALFAYPQSLCTFGSTYIFVSDAQNERIRLVDFSSKTVSTFAGKSGNFAAGLRDGIGTSAGFSGPYPQSNGIQQIATDNNQFLYVADAGYHAIRQIRISSAAVVTIAGNGVAGNVNGQLSASRFSGPFGVAASTTGSEIYVADTGNNAIRKITLQDQQVATVTTIQSPSNLAIDSSGKLYVASTQGSIFALTIVKSGNVFDVTTANIASVWVGMSVGLAVDFSGFLYFTESYVIKRYHPMSGQVTTLAGSGAAAEVDGVGTAAAFNSPIGIAISSAENYSSIFVVTFSSMLRQVRLYATAPCSAGYICGPGSSSAQASICPPSFFCPSATQQSIICPSGSFCPSGSGSPTVCPAGYYCPTGSLGGLPCLSGAICNQTGLATYSQCPAGMYCDGPLLQSPSGYCLVGYYCPVGSSSLTQNACPVGSVCPARSASPQFCPAGFYCATTGLSAPTGSCSTCPAGSSSQSSVCMPGTVCNQNSVSVCPIGSYCTGSGAAITCVAGQICSQPGLSQPALCPAGSYCPSVASNNVTLCSSGSYCPAGSSSSTACPAGLYSALNGSSVCFACPAGKYSSSPGSTRCLNCVPSTCFLGSTQPQTGDFSTLSSAPSVINDPFEIEMQSSLSVWTEPRILVISVGGSVVVLLLFLAIGAQKLDSVGSVLNCSSGESGSLHWASFDLLFSHAHFVPEGGVLQKRQTSFGGFMTCTTAVIIVILGILLGMDNLTPAYRSSISTVSPTFDPRGTFSVTALVNGFGLANCSSSSIALASTRTDWVGTIRTSTSTYSAGSCRCTWTCSACRIVSTSNVLISLVSSQPQSWATFVDYTIELPGFFAPSLVSSGSSYALSGTVAPLGVETDSAAISGTTPTVVSILLTPFNVSYSTTNSKIAYQPALQTTKIGSTTDPSTFDFSNLNGFRIDFQFNRNSISIIYTVTVASIFTYSVLLASLAGTVISGMAALVGFLENRLKITSVWGAPLKEGDIAMHQTVRIDRIESHIQKSSSKSANKPEIELQPVIPGPWPTTDRPTLYHDDMTTSLFVKS